MALLDLNFEGAAEWKAAEPGMYEMMVQKVEVATPKEAGKSRYLKINASFIDSEVGSPINFIVSLSPNPVSKAFLRKTVGALLGVDLSEEEGYQLDTDDLAGCSFMAEVTNETYTGKDGTPAVAAKIKNVYPISMAGSFAPARSTTLDFGDDD